MNAREVFVLGLGLQAPWQLADRCCWRLRSRGTGPQERSSRHEPRTGANVEWIEVFVLLSALIVLGVEDKPQWSGDELNRLCSCDALTTKVLGAIIGYLSID